MGVPFSAGKETLPRKRTSAPRQLLPAERDLWFDMSGRDQRHAIVVAKQVAVTLGPQGTRPVIAAALLHDLCRQDRLQVRSSRACGCDRHHSDRRARTSGNLDPRLQAPSRALRSPS